MSPKGTSEPLAPFSPGTRAWFDGAFSAPTRVQRLGWPAIARGDHTLLIAPTGSGKTLAAFLWAIDRCFARDVDAEPFCQVLYVSPLKALVHDVERNLRAPLAGIARQRADETVHRPSVSMRTGDTPQKERQGFLRNPADILVTTPESLFLLLSSRARATLARVHTVIVDEIHVMAGSKRGVHLALSLERLSELCEVEPQRIGLSATVDPIEDVAAYLGGDRPVEIVDASNRPRLELTVTTPVRDLENLQLPPKEDGRPQTIWDAMYPALLERVLAHRSTILFVNNRGLCERLAGALNELSGKELVAAHHGSIAHAQRTVIEERLKRGEVRGLVATATLELGIDMGAVDQVLLVSSPPSVASGLQRVGRAGHGVGEVSQGYLYPRFKGELLEAAVVARRMLEGALEPLGMPRNCLDVLAQQVVAWADERELPGGELHALVRRAAPYRELSREALGTVLDMLSGRYPSDHLADLRPRINYDRVKDTIISRRGGVTLARLNAGTIPDRGLYAVHLGEGGPRIGELDEEMVFESRPGDTFLLGASTWRVQRITRDQVIVQPAPGEPGRMPFWHGEGPGRPAVLGEAVGAFLREATDRPADQVHAWIRAALPLDDFAAENLASFVVEQLDATQVVPSDRTIVVERFRDELGDWRLCILSPWGRRVHHPWGLAIQAVLGRAGGDTEVQVHPTDDGIVLRLADTEELPLLELLFPQPEDLEDLLLEQLADSAMFAGRFRENAARALLLPRRNPRRRQPLWMQRLKAQELQAGVRQYPDFPLLLETYRECLQDVFDVTALTELLVAVREQRVKVVEVETRRPSPLSRTISFGYVARFLYQYDQPLAERRAQALTLDRDLLRSLLGQEELRKLLDPEVLAEIEAVVGCTAPHRRARSADGLHDLLRRIGPLTREEVAARFEGDPDPVLTELHTARRVIEVVFAGRPHQAAVEDAARLRDGLGVVLPPGIPAVFLEAVPEPFAGLVRQFARGRGPFTTGALAARLGLSPAAVEPTLEGWVQRGILVHDALRPEGTELEWCDAEVLQRLRRASLARLRAQVAPVDGGALARFVQTWHGMDNPAGGIDALEDAIEQLGGVALSLRDLEARMLPARVRRYQPAMLDQLMSSGAVIWAGAGANGPRDGRVALYWRDRAGLLLPRPDPAELPSDDHRTLLTALEDRGASFFVELGDALPDKKLQDVQALLWDLVWAGHVTNDTLAVVRQLGAPTRRRSRLGRLAGRSHRELGGGRWWALSSLHDEVEPTRLAHARAQAGLLRFGVLSREGAAEAGWPGGLGAVYDVLRAMEDAGRVRRGHFVDGLTGAQFALPGAVDRLRQARDAHHERSAVALAATDPAQIWGALLGWPGLPEGAPNPARTPGAVVVLGDGVPVLYSGRGGRTLLVWEGLSDAGLARICHDALAAAVAVRGKHLRVERINGEPALDSSWRTTLERLGWESDGGALVLRAPI